MNLYLIFKFVVVNFYSFRSFDSKHQFNNFATYATHKLLHMLYAQYLLLFHICIQNSRRLVFGFFFFLIYHFDSFLTFVRVWQSGKCKNGHIYRMTMVQKVNRANALMTDYFFLLSHSSRFICFFFFFSFLM